MPALKNARWERFAQERAKGKSQVEAYALAGYSGSPAAMEANASRLIGKDKVAARVAELQDRAAEKAEWTAADRLKMLSDIAQATKLGDPRVAVSAIAEANKMQGSHAPAKTDVTNSDGSLKPAPPAVIQIVGVAAQDDDGAGPVPE